MLRRINSGVETVVEYPDDTPEPVVCRQPITDDYLIDWSTKLGHGSNVSYSNEEREGIGQGGRVCVCVGGVGGKVRDR